MIDISTFPMSAGVILGAGLWAATSYTITGPLVAERTLAASDWGQVCEAQLIEAARAQRSPPRILPRTDCNAVLGGLMPELGQLCRQIGNPDLGGPQAQMMREQARQSQLAEQRRLSQATSGAASRCDCAAALVAEDRVAWALYAGSARLITPPELRRLPTTLTAALRDPLCTDQ